LNTVVELLTVIQGSAHSKPLSTSGTFHLQHNMAPTAAKVNAVKQRRKSADTSAVRVLGVMQCSAHSRPVLTSATLHLQNQAAAAGDI
jgi:hypothetical protein